MTRRFALLLLASTALGCGQEKSQPSAASTLAVSKVAQGPAEAPPKQAPGDGGAAAKGKGGPPGVKGKGRPDRAKKTAPTPDRAKAVALLNARGGKYWDAAGKQEGPIVGAVVTGFGDADLADLVAAAPTLQVVELPNTINNRNIGVLADLPDLRHIKGCASL